jgi:hypothetical protein
MSKSIESDIHFLFPSGMHRPEASSKRNLGDERPGPLNQLPTTSGRLIRRGGGIGKTRQDKTRFLDLATSHYLESREHGDSKTQNLGMERAK